MRLIKVTPGYSSVLGGMEDAVKPGFEIVPFYEDGGDNAPEGREDGDGPCVSYLASAGGDIHRFLG